MNISQVLTKLKALIYSKSETDSLLGGKANSSHTHTKSQITDFPAYGTTAGTICQGNDARLSDARTPTSHTHTKSEITDFPTIPTVNNATLTIQTNGSNVATFTANASSNVTANISVPTNTNQLTNGAGFITSSGSCNYANSAGSSSIATRNSGGSWIRGRDNAVVKQTKHSTSDGDSWNPAVSIKTKNGNWTIGTVGYNRLQFSYDTDEDYNADSNRSTVVELNPENGRIITSANTGNISISGYQVYVG